MNFFPELRKAEVEFEKFGVVQKRDLLPDRFRFSCSNRLCSSKKNEIGFNFMQVLKEMINNNQKEKEGTIRCEGIENMGHGQTRQCGKLLNYKIKVEYNKQKYL